MQNALSRADPENASIAWAMSSAAIPDKDQRDEAESLFGEDYPKKVHALSVSIRIDHEISLRTTLDSEKDDKTGTRSPRTRPKR